MPKAERIDELQKLLKEAADAYYNSGQEIMSNKEYDALFDELKILEEAAGISDGFTSRVGAPTGKLTKVRHEYTALSLGKTKNAEDILSVHNDPEHSRVCLSWKCDGSTVQLTYEDGKLKLAATRGDGRVGQDITQNAMLIRGIPSELPVRPEKLVVRGEALMTYDEFERLNTGGQYANPRNLANATISAQDRDLLKERKVEFKAFELVDCSDSVPASFTGRLDFLESIGFGVVEHKALDISELKEEMERWSETERINSLGFPVDGLVIAGDDCEYTASLPGTEHHPNLAKGMAFKWADETAETVLRKILWSPSRTGLLNPVAVFDTVELCGTKVSRASLHNLSYVESLDLREGDRITVYKANMIIPQVDENLDAGKDRVQEEADILCPACGSRAKVVDNNGVRTVVCPNENCSAKGVGRLAHFVSKHGMNIDGLSDKTLELLTGAGLIREACDLYSLEAHKEEMYQLEGLGKLSVDNLLKAIEASKETDISHFLYAFGIEGFGRGQIKSLKTYLDTHYAELKERYCPTAETFDLPGLITRMNDEGFDFTAIEGIGQVLASNFSSWVKNNLSEEAGETMPKKALRLVRFSDREPERKQGGRIFEGKSFCITGSLETFRNRDEMIAFLEENGGKFVSSVSKKTDYLINNDRLSSSGKNKKAQQLGIPILSEHMVRDAVEKGVLRTE